MQIDEIYANRVFGGFNDYYERYIPRRSIMELDKIPFKDIAKPCKKKVLGREYNVLQFNEKPVMKNGIIYEIPDGFVRAVQEYLFAFGRPEYFIVKKVESVKGIEYEIEEV